MKGFIKLTVVEREDESAIQVECNLANVGTIDKYQLVDALMRGLKLSEEDKLACVLLSDVVEPKIYRGSRGSNTFIDSDFLDMLKRRGGSQDVEE